MRTVRSVEHWLWSRLLWSPKGGLSLLLLQCRLLLLLQQVRLLMEVLLLQRHSRHGETRRASPAEGYLP